MIKKIYEQESADYKCTNDYIEVERPWVWMECPKCKLKPVIWIFPNGHFTACGCGNNETDHFTIKSESVSSAQARGGSSRNEDTSPEDQLLEVWNHWCRYGEDLFEITKPKYAEVGILIW